MAGQEKRHSLIAELRIAHAAAVLIARLHEHRKKIVTLGAVLVVLTNDPVDQRIEGTRTTQVAKVARQRHPIGYEEWPAEPGRDLIGDRIEGAADGVHVGADVRIEE